MNIDKLKCLLISTFCMITIVSQVKTMDLTQEENLKNSQIYNVYQKTQRIEMPSKFLCDENICVLSKHIEGNEVLTRINLNYNNFGDEGLLALAKILPTLSSLQELHLYNAVSNGEGALAIIKAALSMPILTVVDSRTICKSFESFALASTDKKFMLNFSSLLESMPDDQIIRSLKLSTYNNHISNFHSWRFNREDIKIHYPHNEKEIQINGDQYQFVYSFDEQYRQEFLGKTMCFSLSINIIQPSDNGYEYRLGIWDGEMVGGDYSVSYSNPYSFSEGWNQISISQTISDQTENKKLKIMLCSVHPRNISEDKTQGIIKIKEPKFECID